MDDDLYVCQTSKYGEIQPLAIIGLVEYEGKLIVLDTKTALVLEDTLGSEEYDNLKFIEVSKFKEYLQGLELR